MKRAIKKRGRDVYTSLGRLRVKESRRQIAGCILAKTYAHAKAGKLTSPPAFVFVYAYTIALSETP